MNTTTLIKVIDSLILESHGNDRLIELKVKLMRARNALVIMPELASSIEPIINDITEELDKLNSRKIQ